MVDVTGIEPATSCLQSRFHAILKSMKFCCAQEIDCKPVAACCLKPIEVFGTSWLSQLQNHLQDSGLNPPLREFAYLRLPSRRTGILSKPCRKLTLNMHRQMGRPSLSPCKEILKPHVRALRIFTARPLVSRLKTHQSENERMRLPVPRIRPDGLT